jgi:hypothetical protein
VALNYNFINPSLREIESADADIFKYTAYNSKQAPFFIFGFDSAAASH